MNSYAKVLNNLQPKNGIHAPSQCRMGSDHHNSVFNRFICVFKNENDIVQQIAIHTSDLLISKTVTTSDSPSHGSTLKLEIS